MGMRFTIPTSLTVHVSAILLALLCTTPALAATEIRTAPQEASEPKFVMLEQAEKKVTGGLCIDIMHAIERVDPSLKFVIDQEWQSLVRLEAGLAIDKYDAVCGVVRTPEREAKFNFAEQPLFPVTYHLAVRADDPVQIKTWDDVRKLGDQGVILMISGFGIINKLQKMGGLRIDSSGKDSQTNIQKLLGERGRFFYHRSPGIGAEIRKAGATSKVKLLPTVMDHEQFYMELSKGVPANVVEKINKAIIRLAHSGELKKLLDKWDNY